ncbi:hypothetical protein [Microbacterium sp. CJ88]|uniref:hypothetical protein n=1 Tax=Microbacterium sp. CJ88 TaxID=3445672 RepID=UPI003F656DAE
MSRSAGWLVLAVAFVVGAALQGLTATPGYAGFDGAFWAVAVASLVLLWLELAVVTAAAGATAGLRPAPVRTLAATGLVALGGGILAVVVPLALPLYVVLALCVLPGAATERQPHLGFATFRYAPLRAVLAVIVSLAVSILTWVVAFASGLFLTGTIGGIAMWLWFGIAGGLQLVWWSHLLVRARTRATASVSR